MQPCTGSENSVLASLRLVSLGVDTDASALLTRSGKHLELFSSAEPLFILTEGGPYTPQITQGVIRAAIGVAAFAGLREGDFESNGGKTTMATF